MELKLVAGSDHAGFDLKEACIAHLKQKGNWSIHDVGVFEQQAADYPQIAHMVAAAVSRGEFPFGLLVCGTGLGMSMVANRYPGVRAALCHNQYTARMSRQHNDANILVLGGRVLEVPLALEILDLFLETPFEGGRHLRRVEQFER